jgi:NitT/TauT family transport system ATP-binding protein
MTNTTTDRYGESAEVELEVPLRVSGLGQTYARKRQGPWVLRDLDLEVNQGEFVAVMGPSGCGKSTLLNVVAGFEKPTEGSVHSNGRVNPGPGADRGVVFQRPTLFPWMSVIDNVMFGPKATGKSKGARERANEILAEVGLKGYEKRRTYELSGGMQHRVAIARTLVAQPSLLLMDEPFGALDAQTRTEMQSLLLDVWQRHRSTVLFVTHDIEEGLLLADRIVVLGVCRSGAAAVVDVDIPRPRTYETVMTERFIELRRHVRSIITDAANAKGQDGEGHGQLPNTKQHCAE